MALKVSVMMTRIPKPITRIFLQYFSKNIFIISVSNLSFSLNGRSRLFPAAKILKRPLPQCRSVIYPAGNLQIPQLFALPENQAMHIPKHRRRLFRKPSAVSLNQAFHRLHRLPLNRHGFRKTCRESPVWEYSGQYGNFWKSPGKSLSAGNTEYNP